MNEISEFMEILNGENLWENLDRNIVGPRLETLNWKNLNNTNISKGIDYFS